MTLIEVLTVLAITAILSAIVALSFSNFRKGQGLPNAVDEVMSLLNEAHSRTLSGENALQYGVHLQSDKAVLFVGTSYSSSASTNRPVSFISGITIASISLNGGGSDVVFNKLTGETSQYGTFIVKDSSTTVGQKTVTIVKTGLVSVN